MSLYTLLLFVHITGAVCLFSGMGIWLFGIAAIVRATRVEQIRTLADLLLMVRLVVPASALLVIAAGVAMTWIAWGFQTGWIVVALGSLGVIGPIGTWVVDPKVRAIANLAQALPDGTLPPILGERAHDRVLRLAIDMLVAMLFGIVFLMTTKPSLVVGLAVMVVSALVGLVSSAPFLLARQVPTTSAMGKHHE
jgi:hypothetical protein